MLDGAGIARSHKIALIFIHLAALFAWVFIHALPGDLILAVVFYVIRILGIAAGYHRLFTHRAYNANLKLATALAVMGNASGHGPIKRWVANHWLHHRFAETEFDPHSPARRGFWYAHIGWLLDAKQFDRAIAETKKFTFPAVIEWIDQNSNLLFFAQIPLLIALHALGSLFFPQSFAPFGLGAHYSFSVAIVIGLHSIFAVNSICHLWGYSRKDSMDDSRNNPLVALMTLGEGWHSNHHSYPHSVRHGFEPKEVDLTYLVICGFEKMGWASNLTMPPRIAQAKSVRKSPAGPGRVLHLVPRPRDSENLRH